MVSSSWATLPSFFLSRLNSLPENFQMTMDSSIQSPVSETISRYNSLTKIPPLPEKTIPRDHFVFVRRLLIIFLKIFTQFQLTVVEIFSRLVSILPLPSPYHSSMEYTFSTIYKAICIRETSTNFSGPNSGPHILYSFFDERD